MEDTLQGFVAQRLIDNLRNETMVDLAPSPLRLPVTHFTSNERADAEIALMKRLPLVIGHSSDLPTPGSFVTQEVFGIPILVARRQDGLVAAYINMCRHRGGRVETEPSGVKRVVTCRYHGWSYNLDGGDLRHVPYGSSFGEVDRTCYGLTPVHVEEHSGLLWATFSPDDVVPTETFLGPEAGAQLESFQLERCVTFLNESFTVPINWKIVMDGACDVLHLRFLHPNGVGKLLATARSMYLHYGRHGQNFTPRKKLVDLAREGGELDRMWKYIGSNLRIYPNAMCIAAPDHVEFWTVWPEIGNPARCTVNIRFYILPDILDEEMAKRLTLSWEILREASFNEDFPMEESIQHNAQVNPSAYFTYGRSETSIRHLHENLEHDLAQMVRT